MRVRWKAFIPLLGIIGSWLASPEVLSLVSEEHAHVLLALSSLIAVVTPALLTNRPPSDPPTPAPSPAPAPPEKPSDGEV